jgi:hypothetical protein
MPDDAGNPRAPRGRPSADLIRAVRDGRGIGEALRALDVRAVHADDQDRALADELARFLVRRCEERHAGWQALRQVLLDAGAEVAWARCERAAHAPTADRVLGDCAGPGRTPLIRVQHAAAQERARALAVHVDAASVLRRLEVVPRRPVAAERWEHALVGAVAARSREQVTALLADGVRGDR